MMSDDRNFETTVNKVVEMARDPKLRDRLRQLDLDIVNVMWEDTARTAGSVWGPNITDMTLQVRHGKGNKMRSLLPVIRYPNFTDKTGDVPLDLVSIKVGNEAGKELQVIPLKDYLNNLSDYISDRNTIHEENQPLITDRDSHVLVSAQACVLPIPQQGKCGFNPVLFNYQSRPDSPAVLAVLITPEGSSATVLDNDTDLAEWGQNVFFNNNGQKTCLTGERLSDYKANLAAELARSEGISVEEAGDRVTVADDVNMVMVIQVPLKPNPQAFRQEERMRDCFAVGGSAFYSKSDMEDAVISHGENEGKHPELGDHRLERDDRYPIRVTVQFYKATSNGIVDEEDLANIYYSIETAYTSADYIGSLVVGSLEKGSLGMGEARPTQPAASAEPVLTPPKDYLQFVNPFGSHQQPKA